MLRYLIPFFFLLLFDPPETPALRAPIIDKVAVESVVESVGESVVESVGESVVESEEPQETAQTPTSAPQDDEIEPHDDEVVWSEEDHIAAIYIAKTLYGECRACPPTEQAAVVWCVLNRVDSQERYFPNDIVSVITQQYQFAGYSDTNPVRDDLLAMAYDVLARWYAEKRGEESGRVLPASYCFFYGDGKHNHFTEEWRGTAVWDWSLDSPY
jgi:hypothetical protein